MGAAEKLDTAMTAFFENKNEELGYKRHLLTILRDEADTEAKVIQFRAYCLITEKAHIDEIGDDYDKVAPGYANIKIGSCII